jgi:hypothetical protein
LYFHDPLALAAAIIAKTKNEKGLNYRVLAKTIIL